MDTNIRACSQEDGFWIVDDTPSNFVSPAGWHNVYNLYFSFGAQAGLDLVQLSGLRQI